MKLSDTELTWRAISACLLIGSLLTGIAVWMQVLAILVAPAVPTAPQKPEPALSSPENTEPPR